MAARQNHIVHTLKYKVEFEDSNRNNNKQHDILGRMHHEKIEPLLQQTFDSICKKNEHLQIEKLELDLGTIPTDKWENGFTDEIILLITEKLSEIKSYTNSKIEILPPRNKTADSSGIKLLPTANQEEDLFLFFLQNGYQNWNIPSHPTISFNKIFEKIISRKSADFHKKLSLAFKHSDFVIQRFITQIKQDLRVKWITSWYPEFIDIISELEKVLPRQLHSWRLPKKRINDFISWLKEKIVFYVLSEDIKAQLTEKFCKAYSSEIIFFFEEDPIHLKKEKTFPKKLKLRSPFTSSVLELITNNIKNGKTEIKKKVRKKSTRSKTNVKTDIKNRLDNTSEETQKEFEKGIFANNAGLVVLWPYLNSLFKELNLLDKNRFLNDKAKQQALFILHYLATGETKTEEHELLIPKIITGYTLQQTVPLTIHLEQSVTDECDKLLQNAIRNWSILKSTTPNGLRQSFLQRNAIIKFKEKQWHFLFERKGIDILIDRLPYGLSVIKFNWLMYPIYVSW
ncbi:contractile injection system tape measure protein [Draconibacterium sp.]|nr:contractile injection system tape measure protein [Draconibacterium sp.]